MNFAGAPYWDLTTTILYIIMGLIPVWAIYESDKSTIVYKRWWKNPYFMVWIIIWTIFGGGRLVTFGVGGYDAPAYMEYFEYCMTPGYLKTGVMAQYNSNIGYRWLNRFLRMFTSNGYFFIVTESFFLALIPVLFISKFRQKKESSIPYFLMAFWYIRGFSSIRSHLAIAVFLIAIYLLYINKKKTGLLVSIYAILLHPMLAIYFPFALLYLLKRNFKLNIKLVTVLFFLLFIIVIPIKQFFLQNISVFGDFSEHYEGYVNTDDSSFFDNFWKIAFEQLLLLLFMFISKRGLKKYSHSLDHKSLNAYNLIYKLCMYDFLLVPICYALSIWRGYEVCYIPRLIMWGIIVSIGAKKFPYTFRWSYNLIISAAFLAWFIQRTGAESFWKDTNLMPYVFAPIFYFF